MYNSLNSNDDSECLREILRQIIAKCKTKHCKNEPNSIKYAELIEFVIELDWFCEQLRYLDLNLYHSLHIHEQCRSFTYPRIHIDFGMVTMCCKQKSRDTFWKTLIKKVKDRKGTLNLNYTSGLYYEEHLMQFNMIINEFHENSLMSLTIDINGYFLEYLPNYCNLKKLHIQINAEVLVKCFKLHNKGHKLSLFENEKFALLAEILQEGNVAHNLDDLEVLMQPDINVFEYAPLAKNAIICYSFYPFQNYQSLESVYRYLSYFTAMKMNGAPGELPIYDVHKYDLQTEVIFEIFDKTGRNDKYLKKLKVTSLNDMMFGALQTLQSTNQWYFKIGFHGHNVFGRGKIWYSPVTGELIWRLGPKQIDTFDCTDLCVIPNLQSLSIQGYGEGSDSIRNRFKGFPSRMRQTLEKLKFSSKLNSKEISEIAAIKSLKSLNCRLADVSNIDLLGQLPYLQELTMFIPRNLATQANDALKKLFQILASTSTPTLQYLDISGISIDVNLAKELIRIKSIKILKCGFVNPEAITLLSSLTKLSELQIKSKDEFNNISSGILQILLSTKNCICISFIALETAIYYDSLSKKLELYLDNYTDANPYAVLGNLENCHSILVEGPVKHCSLQSLLRTLVTRKNNFLKELRLKMVSFLFEEFKLVSQIKTLEKVTIPYLDYSFLKSLPQVKQISTTGPCDRTLYDFLKRSSEEVKVRTCWEDIMYNKKDGKLTLNVNLPMFGFSEIGRHLGTLDNIQILHMYDQRYDFKNILTDLASKPVQTLRELIIEPRNEKTGLIFFSWSLTTEELMCIAQMKSLRKLKCGLSPNVKSEILAQLEQLEELTITIHKSVSLEPLFKEFSSQPSAALQCLSIQEDALTADELKAIAGIKSLKRLDCSFDYSIDWPIQPHLKELFIRNQSYYGPKISINSQNIAALARSASLRKLHIKTDDFNAIKHLSSHNQLEELHIELVRCDKSLKIPLKFLKLPLKLRMLVIQNLTIDEKDIMKVFKNSDIKSLHCILKKLKQFEIRQTELCIVTHFQLIRNNNLTLQLKNLVIRLSSNVKSILQLLAKEPQSNLECLVVKYHNFYDQNYLALAQISTLTTLDLEYMNLDFVKHLRNIKKLILRRFTVLATLLVILKNCTKLQSVELHCDGQMKYTFFEAALNILKGVRNPILQKPLELRLLEYHEFSPGHLMNAIDKEYLSITTDTDEFEHYFSRSAY